MKKWQTSIMKNCKRHVIKLLASRKRRSRNKKVSLVSVSLKKRRLGKITKTSMKIITKQVANRRAPSQRFFVMTLGSHHGAVLELDLLPYMGRD